MMLPFDFQMRTRIVFGPNAIDALGELSLELAGRRVLVVTDPGIVAAGHAGHGLAALEASGCTTQLFDGTCENPTTREVAAGLEVAQQFRPDLIVGLGGGSSMDCAKGINFLYTNGGRMQDYWGVGKATQEMLPMIAVPTTAGTGSEAQSFALISDAETHVKMACGDKKASCRIAILDPCLTLTKPQRVTALTGIDALAHALETYVTRPRNSISLAFSREAWRLLATNFDRVLQHPQDLAARGGMQLGACLAGLAIENSMLGAAHALANPLTARYDVVHGQAVALMLPHVIRYNGQEFDDWYRELLVSTSNVPGLPSPSAGSAGLADYLTGLIERAGLHTRLAQTDVDRARLAELAQDATQQWTGTFNPRELARDDFLRLYEQAC